MKFLENLCKSYVNNVSIYGYNTKDLFNMVSLYIVPMCNPDGVDLVTGLINENSWAYRNAKQISNNFPNIESSEILTLLDVPLNSSISSSVNIEKSLSLKFNLPL